MAKFKTLDAKAFKAAGRRGQRAHAAAPRAISARFDKRTGRVVVKLDTGIDLSFDPKRAYGLAGADAADLAVEIEGGGTALHFPRLDADFTVQGLLEGFLGPLNWARREARAAASRENGRRGGRPPKAPEGQAGKVAPRVSEPA